MAVRVALGGKTDKTEVLPGFCNIECGGGSSPGTVADLRLACKKSAVAALAFVIPKKGSSQK